MQRQLHSAVSVGMPVVRLLSRPHVEIAIAYLAGYVLLDWLSYVHPYAAFGITPWNPPTGLSFALDPAVRRRVSALAVRCSGAGRRDRARLRPAVAGRDRGGRHHRQRLCGRHRPAADAAPALRRGAHHARLAAPAADGGVRQHGSGGRALRADAGGVRPAAGGRVRQRGAALLGRRHDRRRRAHAVPAGAHDAPASCCSPRGRPLPC